MAYERQTFIDNETVLTADMLNHIEDGIIENSELIGGSVVKSYNLLPNTLTTQTANGITMTVNDDKSVTLNGSATYLTFFTMPVTLQAGSYILSGCPSGGNAQTYHYMILLEDGSYPIVYNDYSLTLATEQTLKILIRIVGGTTMSGQTFYPMIRNSNVADSTYIPHGKMVYTGGVFKQIEDISKQIEEVKDSISEDVLNITGYAKTNLLNNTLNNTVANGITFIVNDDKTIIVNGTASALTYLSWKVELQPGEYILNGLPETASADGLHYMISRADGSYFLNVDSVNGAKIDVIELEVVTIYLRIVSGAEVKNAIVKPMIRLASVYDSRYVPYDKLNPQTDICSLIDTSEFNWSGKKMNVIGDSIVQGSYGNFANVIGGILNLSVVRNYGIGGCCMASTAQDANYSPVVLRYMDMDDDSDIIIVHAGTNDYSAQVPLGDSNSDDPKTFNGALNIIMTGLREKYPDKLIIFSGILHRFNDSALEIACAMYREAMKNRCEANKIVYYDSYHYTGFDFVKGYYDHVLTNDGLHPNQKGAKILGRKLAGFIRWQ